MTGALPLPTEQIALAMIGLTNGLAIEELADPGAVTDELLGEALRRLLPEAGTPRSA